MESVQSANAIYLGIACEAYEKYWTRSALQQLREKLRRRCRRRVSRAVRSSTEKQGQESPQTESPRKPYVCKRLDKARTVLKGGT